MQKKQLSIAAFGQFQNTHPNTSTVSLENANYIVTREANRRKGLLH